MAFQPGFFDVDNRIEKIKEYNSPLLRLADYIDFNFFRDELEKYFGHGKDYTKGGRPPYDYVLMFKILVLQHFYNISDDQTEFCINDRFSFMQFLNLQLGQRVPDAKTIWHFKNELSREDMINKLFTLLHNQLLTDGKIKFYLPFDDFKTRPTFSDTYEYLMYKKGVLNFVQLRSRSIEDYVALKMND